MIRGASVSRRAVWGVVVVACGLTGLLSPPALAHPGGGHLALGGGESRAAQALRLEASDAVPRHGRLGTAWFAREGRATIEIALSCVQVHWVGATYTPLFIPFGARGHTLFAAGRGGDGRRYRLTLWVQPWDRGFSGGFKVRRGKPGRMPCGARRGLAPLKRGAFAIAP